jgi:hypothetical protein
MEKARSAAPSLDERKYAETLAGLEEELLVIDNLCCACRGEETLATRQEIVRAGGSGDCLFR